MQPLLADYIFSDTLRYEGHKLIYIPENGDPIVLGGIDDLTGKFSKHSRLVMRKKEWHYPDGRVFGCGPKEVYELRKRNYKRNPRTPAEQVQYEKWKAVCQEASRIAKDPNHPRYQEMVTRHAAQLRGKPDPVLGKKRICQFGNFVRAVLSHE